MLELNYQISLVIIQMEDLKSILAIQKTTSSENQRREDPGCPNKPTEKAPSGQSHTSYWDKEAPEENMNINIWATLIFNLQSPGKAKLYIVIIMDYKPNESFLPLL